MADQQTPKETTSNDEIDLGQLFNMIGKGFTNLFNFFLRFFLYIKRNIIKFVILSVVGLLLGYGLNQIIVKKQKIEVIVKPNLESKNYLYDVVDEIGSNIKAKDTVFFSKLATNKPTTRHGCSKYRWQIQQIKHLLSRGYCRKLAESMW